LEVEREPPNAVTLDALLHIGTGFLASGVLIRLGEAAAVSLGLILPTLAMSANGQGLVAATGLECLGRGDKTAIWRLLSSKYSSQWTRARHVS